MCNILLNYDTPWPHFQVTAFNIDSKGKEREIFLFFYSFFFNMILILYFAYCQFGRYQRISEKYNRKCSNFQAKEIYFLFAPSLHDMESSGGDIKLYLHNLQEVGTVEVGGIFGNKRHITVCWGHRAAYIVAASYRYGSRNILFKIILRSPIDISKNLIVWLQI